MTEGVDDKSKRRFLVASTSVIGAVGVGFAVWPFLASLKPSARTQAAGAPVEVDISKLEDGQRLIVEWRGKPIWIVKRSEKILADLKSDTLIAKLRDPESGVTEQQPAYAQNQNRSIKSEYLVVIGICTHLGCSPTYVKENDPHDLGSDWQGGFFCPCHGSFFDLAGRVFSGVPAPTNLVVPPHTYLSNTRILVGVDQDKGVA
ncbi:MAG: ubiquinol-cytochrome c reductase iron-sulfur subunit [Pseudomonadota bacterium]